MRNFLLGFTSALLVLALAAFIYIRLGFVDSRADIPVNRLEQKLAMPSLDASVDRHAPHVKNPIDPTEGNLIAGMAIYQRYCAECHGDVNHPHARLAYSLYPRSPQFVEDAPDMPEYQNFYIIKHGIRLSGMPAWNESLSEQQLWQVTTFLSNMDKLPASIEEKWKKQIDASVP